MCFDGRVRTARRGLQWLIPILVLLAGCASAAPEPTPALIVEDPWVRTTEGATDTTMTAAFLSIVNPGDADVRLLRASSEVAGMVQLHEMVAEGDTMVMQEAAEGILIPAGSHEHLTPGGHHVMLMDLRRALPIGDEVDVTLEFSDGSTQTITALVKEFTEEEDHYHPPADQG